MFKWREGMLSPRALVRGNPARVKFTAENITRRHNDMTAEMAPAPIFIAPARRYRQKAYNLATRGLLSPGKLTAAIVMPRQHRDQFQNFSNIWPMLWHRLSDLVPGELTNVAVVQNLCKTVEASQSHKIDLVNYCIAVKFDRHLSSCAVKILVKFFEWLDSFKHKYWGFET